MSFELSECADEVVWDQWVRESPQGTPFCSSWFLGTLDAEVLRFLLLEDGRPVLGCLLFKSHGNILRAPLPSCFYQGLLFAPGSKEAPHRVVRKHLERTESLLAELERRFEAISFCLHPDSPDIRGFSWFHYHEPARGRFEIEVRYTGLVDLEPFESCNDYLGSIRELRRREYHKSVKRGCGTMEASDESALVPLFGETFARQGVQCTPAQLDFVTRVARAALQSGVGQILHCLNDAGEVVSAVLFLHGRGTSYYLFGANGDSAASCGAGTRIMVDSFFEAKKRGCRKVDLLGLNSPGRGDFKASFNAEPCVYFHAHWRKPD